MDWMDTKKVKWLVGIAIGIMCVALAGGGVLAYFYGKTNKQHKEALAQVSTLQTEINKLKSSCQGDISSLESEQGSLASTNARLKKENQILSSDLSSCNDKRAKAKKYNDVFVYIVDVIQTHNGLSGITSDEFNHGMEIAEKTGDQDLTNLLDSAWNATSADAVARLASVLDYLAGHINENVQ